MAPTSCKIVARGGVRYRPEQPGDMRSHARCLAPAFCDTKRRRERRRSDHHRRDPHGGQQRAERLRRRLKRNIQVAARRLAAQLGILRSRGFEAVMKARLIAAVSREIERQKVTHAELAQRSGPIVRVWPNALRPHCQAGTKRDRGASQPVSGVTGWR
jgi:hypothetical protein